MPPKDAQVVAELDGGDLPRMRRRAAMARAGNPGIVDTVGRSAVTARDPRFEPVVAPPPPPRPPRGASVHSGWRWMAPVSALLIAALPILLVKAIAALVAVAVVVVVYRKPRQAVVAILVILPFQQLVFAGLYRLGVPGEMVRPAGQWKEAVALGVLIAGLGRALRDRHKLDWVDVVGLLYCGLGLAFLFVPELIIGDALSSQLPLQTRLLGWRTDCLYVALFLACRHIRFDADDVRRLVRTFLVVATVVAAIGIYEWFFDASWNRFWIETLRLPFYKLEVLKVDPGGEKYLFDTRVFTSVGGRQVLRIGSVLLQYLALGYYLTIAVALLADRVVRGRSTRGTGIALALAATGVVLTATRSAVLGLVIVLVLTQFRRAKAGESRTTWIEEQKAAGARIRFSLLLGGLAMVAIPIAAAVGLVDRFNGEDDFSSNESHRGSFEVSYDILVNNPLGRGLATSAGAGQRAAVEGFVVTETQLLQIGTQLGVLGMGLWIVFVLGAITAMGRAAAKAPPDVDVSAVVSLRTVLIALIAAGFFLQVYIDFALSWTTWSLAGAALGSVEHAIRTRAPAPVGDAELAAAR